MTPAPQKNKFKVGPIGAVIVLLVFLIVFAVIMALIPAWLPEEDSRIVGAIVALLGAVTTLVGLACQAIGHFAPIWTREEHTAAGATPEQSQRRLNTIDTKSQRLTSTGWYLILTGGTFLLISAIPTWLPAALTH